MSSFKPIRFNLQFRNGDISVPIRSLKDMGNNMNINDLHDYFISGQLERWLDVHDEGEKAKKVKELRDNKDDEEKILTALLNALELDFSSNEIAEAVTAYVYHQKILKKRENEAKLGKKIKQLIAEDFKGYYKVIQSIPKFYKKEKYDMDFWIQTREAVKTILTNYPEQFKLDFIRFYEIMCEWNPFAIIAVLMEPGWRSYYIYNNDLDSYLSLAMEPLAERYGQMEPKMNLKQVCDFYARLQDFLKIEKRRITVDGRYVFSVEMKVDNNKTFLIKDDAIPFAHEVKYEFSGGNWQEAVKEKKTVMVLACSNVISIRPGGNINIRLQNGSEHPIPVFPLLDGLDFRTEIGFKKDSSVLLYMEV